MDVATDNGGRNVLTVHAIEKEAAYECSCEKAAEEKLLLVLRVLSMTLKDDDTGRQRTTEPNNAVEIQQTAAKIERSAK